ncbi:MAG: helicase RepA family protein [Desulfurivibrionaceae bacterium]|nr:helicase RepA family protein [Desulfurivibrionaceae bacterium]PKN23545.1 MAG: replication protein A [Deltaproteobacteria bacterium HGW-Deltaproteobacteria-3]
MAIDILAALQTDPPELDFIWPGFLAGTVGALVAPGATGKSYWTLEAAISIACSVAGGDLVGLAPTKTGRVVYLAGEDPPSALIRRIHAIGQHLPPESRVAVSQNLTLEPVMGKRLNIMDSKCLDQLIALGTGARLIVLDTLSRIHLLDENSNGDMAQLVSTLEYVADSTDSAVLFLHHVNKTSGKEGHTLQQAARGASALIDNVRWCGFMTRMNEQEAEHLSNSSQGYQPIGNDRKSAFVRFGACKQNYADLQPDRWYERKKGGVLLPVKLTNMKPLNKVKRREEA